MQLLRRERGSQDKCDCKFLENVGSNMVESVSGEFRLGAASYFGGELGYCLEETPLLLGQVDSSRGVDWPKSLPLRRSSLEQHSAPTEKATLCLVIPRNESRGVDELVGLPNVQPVRRFTAACLWLCSIYN